MAPSMTPIPFNITIFSDEAARTFSRCIESPANAQGHSPAEAERSRANSRRSRKDLNAGHSRAQLPKVPENPDVADFVGGNDSSGFSARRNRRGRDCFCGVISWPRRRSILNPKQDRRRRDKTSGCSLEEKVSGRTRWLRSTKNNPAILDHRLYQLQRGSKSAVRRHS